MVSNNGANLRYTMEPSTSWISLWLLSPAKECLASFSTAEKNRASKKTQSPDSFGCFILLCSLLECTRSVKSTFIWQNVDVIAVLMVSLTLLLNFLFSEMSKFAHTFSQATISHGKLVRNATRWWQLIIHAAEILEAAILPLHQAVCLKWLAIVVEAPKERFYQLAIFF